MGQELTVQPGATGLTTSQTRWSEPVFGPRLAADLRDAEKGGVEEALPMLTPDMVNEARAAILTFETGLWGCDPAEIDRMVTKLAAAYRQERVSEEEAEARRSIYVDLLKDIPFDVLAGAFRKAAQTCKFFPTVAEIREIARPELSKRRWRLFCLQRMVAKFEREWREPIPADQLCKPEEARAILEETFGKIGAKPDTPERKERRARSKGSAKTAGPVPKGGGENASGASR